MSRDSRSPGEGTPERTDPLVVEIAIEADADAVWDALSRGEEMTKWFAPEVRVEPGVGGTVFLSWGGGMEGEAPIHLWSPGGALGWTEEHPGPGGETVRLAVEFHLEGPRGGTLVRLVLSGFEAMDDWEDFYDAVDGGWRYFLLNLKEYVERHRGTPRTMTHVRRKTGMDAPEAWRRILSPEGIAGEAVAEGEGEGAGTDGAGAKTVEPGSPFELRVEGRSSLMGECLIVNPPRTFAARIADLDDALLFVEMESLTDATCGVWLSTYGVDEARIEGVRKAIERGVDRAFGG